MTTNRIPGAIQPKAVSSLRYRRNPEALYRYLPDGLVVLGPASSDPLCITGPAAHLWLTLATAMSLRETSAALAQQFSTDPSTVSLDLESIWPALVASHALEPAE